jgi:NADH-quinone oxidoreductase subunit B
MPEHEAPHPNIVVPDELRNNVFVTTLDKLYNWSRKSSMWPLLFGLACCAIEMICTAASRYDLARFGMEIMRPSPRQADLMIVSGTVTKKMVPQIVRIYNQMAQPRYVISMGACATGGGPFKEGYNVVPGIDKYVPVDVYVPGCPPTPEALLYGILKLHEKVEKQSITNVPWYRSPESDIIPVPVLGPDIFDPRRVPEIKAKLAERRAATQTVAAPVTEAIAEAIPTPVVSPTPTAPAGPTKLTPEEIEARRQAALAKRAELQAQKQAQTPATPAAPVTAAAPAATTKAAQIEEMRIQALQRKLEQARAGQGKQTVEEIEKMLEEARARYEKAKAGQQGGEA